METIIIILIVNYLFFLVCVHVYTALYAERGEKMDLYFWGIFPVILHAIHTQDNIILT